MAERTKEEQIKQAPQVTDRKTSNTKAAMHPRRVHNQRSVCQDCNWLLGRNRQADSETYMDMQGQNSQNRGSWVAQSGTRPYSFISAQAIISGAGIEPRSGLCAPWGVCWRVYLCLRPCYRVHALLRKKKKSPNNLEKGRPIRRLTRPNFTAS